ncbi:MAG: hypothetical protein ACPF87_06840, partial [Flavobacteriales bacterium]
MRSSSTNSCCSSLPATLPENTNGWSFGYVFADLTYELPDGCTDATACNYDETATLSDENACDYSCLGCTDPAACNYDLNATADDGSCIDAPCEGCTDVDACNYDPVAVIDNGSCEYYFNFSGDGFDVFPDSEEGEDFDLGI